MTAELTPPALVIAGDVNPTARALAELAMERGWTVAVFCEHLEDWPDAGEITACEVDLADAAAVEASFSVLTSKWVFSRCI